MTSNNYEFSINITEDDLSEDYLIQYLDEKISLYKINPNRIILETWRCKLTGKKKSYKQLTLLKSKGFKIAIDDFGAEYSNFERILDLDIDYIKIDAKYIKRHTNKRSFEIVKAISFFAKNVYFLHWQNLFIIKVFKVSFEELEITILKATISHNQMKK